MWYYTYNKENMLKYVNYFAKYNILSHYLKYYIKLFQ